MENKPEKCATCKRSSKADGWVACANCIHNNSRKDRYEPLTNGDRIRNMTDEELAQLLNTGTFICEGLKDICEYMPGCEVCMLAWLRSPANDGGNEK